VPTGSLSPFWGVALDTLPANSRAALNVVAAKIPEVSRPLNETRPHVVEMRRLFIKSFEW
jgi:hypothetical protein